METPDRAEATPIVKDGRMFVVTTAGVIMALDPATGRTLWTFKPETPFSGKRGIGIGDGLLFAALRDSNVMAISQETGKLVWTSAHPKEIPSQGMSTAPAYGNGVVVGVVSLGDNFLHGRAIAYDAKTGKFLWSFDVVPGPGEPGHETWPQDSDIWKYGGGAIWTTPSVDAELGLVYLPTGNAVPQFGGELRPGNNLYNNSVVALDLKTGKMRWYFQTIHHDIWEHDLSTPLVLYDTTFGGRTRKALAAMRTDGVLFILDRETGKPLAPVEERPVKQDAFLKTSPTQPFTVGGDRVGPGVRGEGHDSPRIHRRLLLRSHLHRPAEPIPAAHEHAPDADGVQPANQLSVRRRLRQPRLDEARQHRLGVHPTDAASGSERSTACSLRSTPGPRRSRGRSACPIPSARAAAAR